MKLIGFTPPQWVSLVAWADANGGQPRYMDSLRRMILIIYRWRMAGCPPLPSADDRQARLGYDLFFTAMMTRCS